MKNLSRQLNQQQLRQTQQQHQLNQRRRQQPFNSTAIESNHPTDLHAQAHLCACVFHLFSLLLAGFLWRSWVSELLQLV